MVDYVAIIIGIVVQTIVLAPVLYFAGRFITKKENVKFTDALWIILLGIIISYGLAAWLGPILLGGLIGAFMGLIVWLFLIKHFFDTGWLKAIIISVINSILLIIIGFVLAFFGLSLSPI